MAEERGKTTEFVNDTDDIIKFYFESPGDNSSLRMTLYPRPGPYSTASVPSGGQRGEHSFKEKVGVNVTYGKLRLSDATGNFTNLFISTDEMDEFRSITVTKDQNNEYVLTRVSRSERAPRASSPPSPSSGPALSPSSSRSLFSKFSFWGRSSSSGSNP